LPVLPRINLSELIEVATATRCYIGIVEQPRQLFRHDLPGDAEAVGEPAAHAFFAAPAEQGEPQPVCLGLIFRQHAD
jgi:hypothetical protein